MIKDQIPSDDLKLFDSTWLERQDNLYHDRLFVLELANILQHKIN